jgi:hypothetical protein
MHETRESTERERLTPLREGRGLWKDREDLPDLRALRKEWSPTPTAEGDQRE